MQRYLEILKSVDLFSGIKEPDILPLLSCLSAKLSHFGKNELVFMCGDHTSSFGIVLSGQVQIYQEDYYGNKNILSSLGPGNLFGESFACAGVKMLPVSVLAVTESDLLFIDCFRLTAPCAKACDFHSRIIQNMLQIISMKNIALTKKIEFTSKRTTREKLLAYLAVEAKNAANTVFFIPFNRQELADYLSVDRSAMSAELGKLRDDGILKFNKNKFELL